MSGGGNEIKETALEKELADIATEKWETVHKEILNPLMDDYMDATDRLKGEDAYAYTRGRVNEANQVQQAGTRDAINERTRGMGVDPNSGRAMMTRNEVDNAQAASAGEAGGRAQMEQTNQYVKGQQTITALGMGQQATAQAGLGGLARQATNEAVNDGYNTFNRNAANMQLVGSVAGAGAHYGMNRPDTSNGTGHGIQPNTGPLALGNNPNVKKPSMFDFSSSDYGL